MCSHMHKLSIEIELDTAVLCMFLSTISLFAHCEHCCLAHFPIESFSMYYCSSMVAYLIRSPQNKNEWPAAYNDLLFRYKRNSRNVSTNDKHQPSFYVKICRRLLQFGSRLV